jgi:pilus assembly protein Flp/PilA
LLRYLHLYINFDEKTRSSDLWSFSFSGLEGVCMSTLVHHVQTFWREESGPTAVEYAVMLAPIIVVCLIAITALGTNANATFTSVSNAMRS